MKAWKVVFKDYLDVWGGLTDEEAKIVQNNFFFEGDFHSVDAFIFPCSSFGTPVSDEGSDRIYLQQFGLEIDV